MLVFKRGDTFRFLVDLYDEVTAAPLNIVGATVTSKLKTSTTQATIASLTASVAPSPAGVVELFKAAGDTVAWPTGEASIDVRLTLASGDVVTTSTARIMIAAAESA